MAENEIETVPLKLRQVLALEKKLSEKRERLQKKFIQNNIHIKTETSEDEISSLYQKCEDIVFAVYHLRTSIQQANFEILPKIYYSRVYREQVEFLENAKKTASAESNFKMLSDQRGYSCFKTISSIDCILEQLREMIFQTDEEIISFNNEMTLNVPKKYLDL